MRIHLVEGGTVVNTIEAESVESAQALFPAAICIEATGGGIGWAFDGTNVTAPTPPSKTPEEIQAEIVAATQERLDAFARTRHYDDIKSASDYAGCSVSRFDIEGTYCRNARAETWDALYTMLGEVQAGTRPMPSKFADIEPELPPLVWPAV